MTSSTLASQPLQGAERPLISIIIPVKNGARFLRHAIQSVADQNYSNKEIIVIDAESSDGTLEILREEAKRLSYLHYVSEPDDGQSDAMNKGLRLARGTVVSYLNSDDYYSPNAFHDAILELAKIKKTPAMAVGNLRVFDAHGVLLQYQKPKHLGLEFWVVGLMQHPWNPTQYFYHKEVHKIIGEFPTDNHLVMDVWFYLEVCSHREITIRYCDRDWGNFRFYPGTKTFENRLMQTTILKGYSDYYRAQMKILPILTVAWCRFLCDVEGQLCKLFKPHDGRVRMLALRALARHLGLGKAARRAGKFFGVDA